MGLKGLNTLAFTEGANLWLSTTPGEITQTVPVSPNHAVFLGNVTRVHANQGTIEVRIQNGVELGEIHDVLLTAPTNGQVLKYDSASGLWVNATDLNSGVWGSITGTLSSQADLQNALDAKQNVSAMSAYLTKADNLGSLTNFATARDNLGLGSLNTPTFAGVNVPGSGTSAANLGATFLTINQQGSGQFTIQPSQGIVFPDATIQTTAYPGPPGATTWGSIGGTLSAQTDLQSALDGKYSTTNPAGYITSAALTPYLLISTAASTYQTIAGMSSYLTTSAAASTYLTQSNAASTYYLQTNPAGYITSSALTGYATESFVTSQGYITDAPSDGNQYARKDGAWDVVSAPASYITSVTSPLSVTSGDLSIDLTGYATESWVSSQGYITSVNFYPLTQDLGFDTYSNDGRLLIDGVWDPSASGFTSARFNIGPAEPSSPLNGDFWSNGTKFRYTLGGTTYNIASESYVTTRGYITSAALSPYLLSSTAASTYQTIAGMSSYLTTASAASTYYLQTNPAGYINATTLGNGSAPAGEDILDALQNAVAPSTSNPYATEGYTDSSISSFAATLSATYATIASPSLTGVPLSTTASPGTNTNQIATTAFVTAAVPAFGATADINEPASTTKAASIDNVRELLLSPAHQVFYQGAGVTGSSGTGAAVNNNGGRWKEYVSPNSGVAGHAKGVFDSASSSVGFVGYQRGANLTSRNWSKKVWLSGRCMVGHFSLTTYNGSANTFARISLGGYNAIGAGDMVTNNRGIGWKLEGGGSSALQLQVSNGSTVTTVTSSFTPVLKEVFDWEIYSDGAGNVTLYVNDNQVATTTAGPTGTQTTGLYMEGVDSTASSTAAFILNNLGTKMFFSV